MNRIGLSNGTWFDADAAECYEESQHFDGSNMISDVTGSQWEHEEMYRTAKGKWVKHSWSQWQGSGQTYEVVSADEAVRWFTSQGMDPPESLEAAAEALEV